MNKMTKTAKSKASSTTVVNKATSTEYVWCNNTKSHEKKGRAVKVNGSGWQFMHHARGRLGFVSLEEQGYTVIRVYSIKTKDLHSTYYFNGAPSLAEIRNVLFDNATHFSTLVKNRVRKPFKAMVRHIILTLDRWEALFEPNTSFTKHRAEDKALKSLFNCLDGSDGREFAADNPCGAIGKAQSAIKTWRNKYKKEMSQYLPILMPVVEVYAIWCNYDPETMYVFGDRYDAFEPLFYSFNKFEGAKDMGKYPM